MVGRGSGAFANGSRRDWRPPESMASCAKTLPSRVRAFGSLIAFRCGRTMGTARRAHWTNAANSQRETYISLRKVPSYSGASPHQQVATSTF